MNNIEFRMTRARTAVSLVAFALLTAGCAGKKDEGTGFATPDDAAKALVAAFQADDVGAAAKLLGPGSEELLSSGDAVADKDDRSDFLAAYAAKNSIALEGDKATLVVGPNDWPLPIPIVQERRQVDV